MLLWCRVLLRLSCSGCELPVVQLLLQAQKNHSRALQLTELLLVDLNISHPAEPASVPAGGTASLETLPNPQLGEMFNLLYQQLGFKGVMRQQLAGGVLQLGFIRRVHRVHSRRKAVERQKHHQLESLRQDL